MYKIDDEISNKHNLEYKMNEHGKICNDIHNLYVAKNSDYGDSMHPLYDEYGLTAFMILFSTKINRIKSLMKKDSANFESIEDSLLDLANYAIIALTELKLEKEINNNGITQLTESTTTMSDIKIIEEGVSLNEH